MKRVNLILIASTMLVFILSFGPASVSAQGGGELKPDIMAPDPTNGWYTGDVRITWPIPKEATVAKGCEETTIDFDTPGVKSSCEVETKEGTLSGSVVIRRDTTAPVININPPSPQIEVNEGDRLVLDAAGSTDETSGVASLGWDIYGSEDSDFDILFDAPGAVNLLAKDGPGEAKFSVQATDQAGNVAEVSVVVIVINVAPELDEISLSGGDIWAGDTVTLEAAFFDPGVLDTHTATVNWGDGTEEAAISIEKNSVTGAHAYLKPGEYTIEVTVTDKDGSSGQAIPVEVKSASNAK